MTDRLRAAAHAALEALELSWASRESAKKSHEAITLLRAALAEQEPLHKGCAECCDADPWLALYCGRCIDKMAEPECCCGESTASGVVHRQDGPCYMAEPVAYIYEVRFTDRPDREWRYYGLYRSKTQVESMLGRTTDDDIEGRIVPLYAHPARRAWVGLTDEEIDTLSRTMVKGDKSVNWLSRAIEAALKEKNT